VTAMTPEDTVPISQELARKQRSQQAKREAKLMLKLQRAKQAVQKAQQKVAKAQSTLEESKARLHSWEEVRTLRQGQTSDHNEPPADAQ